MKSIYVMSAALSTEFQCSCRYGQQVGLNGMSRAVTNRAPLHWQQGVSKTEVECWIEAARKNHVRYRCNQCAAIVWYQKYTEQPSKLPCSCHGSYYVTKVPGKKEIWES